MKIIPLLIIVTLLYVSLAYAASGDIELNDSIFLSNVTTTANGINNFLLRIPRYTYPSNMTIYILNLPFFDDFEREELGNDTWTLERIGGAAGGINISNKSVGSTERALNITSALGQETWASYNITADSILRNVTFEWGIDQTNVDNIYSTFTLSNETVDLAYCELELDGFQPANGNTFGCYNGSTWQPLDRWTVGQRFNISITDIYFTNYTYTLNMNGTIKTLFFRNNGSNQTSITRVRFRQIGNRDSFVDYFELYKVMNGLNLTINNFLSNHSTIDGLQNISIKDQVIQVVEDECNNGTIDSTDCLIPLNITTSSDETFDIASNGTYSFGIDSCLSSYNVPANFSIRNFTFRDEQNDSLVSTDFISEWNFTMGDGNYYDVDVDLDNVFNFSMCLFPNWTRLDVDYQILYSDEPNYPQRRFTDSEILTTNYLDRTLYLLESSAGIYAWFKVVDIFSNPLSGVASSMQLDGEVVEEDTTDDAGLVTFFVDPNTNYIFTFTLAGYIPESFSLRPTTSEIYTVELESSTDDAVGNNTAAGIRYVFSPQGLLQNNTNYEFQFNLSSSAWEITGCNLYLRNGTPITMSQDGGTFNTTNCNIALSFTTRNNESVMYSYGIYQLNNTFNITQIYTYSIATQAFSDTGTIKNLIDDISNFAGSGFDDKNRFLIAFIVIFVITGYISFKFGSTVNPEPSIIALWASVLFFSYINWLTMNIPNLPTGISGLTNQWIIFILITILGGSYIAWRHSI